MAAMSGRPEYRFLITNPIICMIFTAVVLICYVIFICWVHVRARDGRPASDDLRDNYFRELIYVTAAKHVGRHVPHLEGMDGKLDTGEGGDNV